MSAHLKNRGFPWAERREQDGGGRTSMWIVLSCSTCTNEIKFRKHKDKVVPVPTQKRFEREGWQLDIRRPFSAVCPACQIKPSRDNIVQIRSEKPVPVPPLPPIPPPAPKEPAVQSPLQPPKVSSAPQSITPRILTDSEREQVRDFLIRFFDTGTGRYDPAWSDKIIAEKVNVPMVRVIEIREIAFGKLRGDPELERMVQDVAQLRLEQKKLLDALAAQDSRITAISERIAAFQRRVVP
ncbi:MAG TPA: hypothetical protein VD994_00455 [Prosthecobacter sp.]|nr:hypothetical protein [Prosthecobacter sp.]